MAAFAVSAAHAAPTPEDLAVPANAPNMTAQQAYEHDKAFCHSAQSTQPLAQCLKEASRAYQEDKSGTLESDSQGTMHRSAHRPATNHTPSNTDPLAMPTSSSGTSNAATNAPASPAAPAPSAPATRNNLHY
jgi:hypothetical protein